MIRNLSGNKNAIRVLENADIDGNIIVGGTVDGRDVASDGSKLDTIEQYATDPSQDVNTTVVFTTDTLTSSHIWKVTKYSSSSLVTVTVPTGTFLAGHWFVLQSTGAGGLTLSTAGLAVDSSKVTINQYEGLMILFTANNTISVFGGTS